MEHILGASYTRTNQASVSPQASESVTIQFAPTFWTLRVIEAILFTHLHLECIAANHICTILHISIRDEWLATALKGQSAAIADATRASRWPHALASSRPRLIVTPPGVGPVFHHQPAAHLHPISGNMNNFARSSLCGSGLLGRVEVAQGASAGELYALADVGHAVANALQIMRCPQQVGALPNS